MDMDKSQQANKMDKGDILYNHQREVNKEERPPKTSRK